MKKPVIEAVDLIKIYTRQKSLSSVPALRGCDFKAYKGELTAIIGPSGAGKSTLLNIIAGKILPTSGNISVETILLNKLNELERNSVRKKIFGLISQFREQNLIPLLSISQNIKIITYILNKNIKNWSNISIKLGIEKLLTKPIWMLSNGEAIRAALLINLIKKPSILLADEPTGQLDDANTKQIFSLIKGMTHEFGQTTLIVTHDPRIQEYADRTFYIHDGRLSKVEYPYLKNFKTNRSDDQIFFSYLDSTNYLQVPQEIISFLNLSDEVAFIINSKNNSVKINNPKIVDKASINSNKSTSVSKELNQDMKKKFDRPIG